MWKYEQKTGRILHDGVQMDIGYSGLGDGKNDPAFQDVQGVGPIPAGFYEIGEPFNTDTHGPFVMRLTPYPANETFGRSGFLWHGDSSAHPGAASHGCIVSARSTREKVADSGDKKLEVI